MEKSFKYFLSHKEYIELITGSIKRSADFLNSFDMSCRSRLIELITGSIKRFADFLNSFDMSCRSRLSVLNEKLTYLERKLDHLEARVATGGEQQNN